MLSFPHRHWHAHTLLTGGSGVLLYTRHIFRHCQGSACEQIQVDIVGILSSTHHHPSHVWLNNSQTHWCRTWFTWAQKMWFIKCCCVCLCVFCSLLSRHQEPLQRDEQSCRWQPVSKGLSMQRDDAKKTTKKQIYPTFDINTSYLSNCQWHKDKKKKHL